MKNRIALLLLMSAITVRAQQLPRQIVAEHFTNSWCSVCAGRNPGFISNLAQSPDVLHLSIYPSAPYKGCPLSQYATADQDARTNSYGVFGATPRLVVNGKVIDAGADYSRPELFSDERGILSSFELRVELRRLDNGNGEMRAVLYKRDTSSLDSLMLYGLLTQDTIAFAAKNGETRHYNVFRKAMWGKDPLIVAAPAAVGDSLIQLANFAIDGSWDTSRIYATVMAQRRDRSLEQAARSKALSGMSTGMGPTGTPGSNALFCYPNPAVDRIYIKSPGYTSIRIHDLSGRLLIDKVFIGSAGLDISQLAPGMYLYSAGTPTGRATGSFVRVRE